VITIQSAMLVVLGFSIAGLLACVIAPAYRRRAARLATLELKRTMPLTEAEIAADKDRIRADYAIRVHKLESNLEELSLETARQLIEINRRDARISALESDVARLATVNEEHENARRVLELTITDRLPKVEQRLAEAKKLLFERDREISALTQTAQRQSIALEEATQINTQQRNDIHRLNATLTTRAARHRDKAEEQKHETEIALRTEIEALRARVRDQGEIIARLQPGAAEPGEGAEMARLRASLADAERALQEAQRQSVPSAAGADTEARALRSTVEDQATQIARLTAELTALKSASPDPSATADQQAAVGLRAKLSALEAEATEQASIILGLRAEVAASNEKLARQAEFYMEELRKLQAGTRPTAPPPVAEPQPPAAQRLSLAERMNAPRVATVQISNGTAHAANGNEAAANPPSTTSPDEAPSPAADAAKEPRRQSLLQRITGLEKPVA
jgi:hypothetical protein